MLNSVKDRLITYLEHKGVNKSEFGRRIGVSNAYVSSMRKSIQPDKLALIQKEFPDLNTSWLMTGKGKMLRTPETNAMMVGVASNAIKEDMASVRFFEVTPTATFQEFCSGASEEPVTIGIVPVSGEILDDSFCVFEVAGESMAPQIQPHARVLCQEIPPTRWHLLTEAVVVIAYSDKFVIKRITANHLSESNYLTLASDNPDYPQREIVQLADIRAIFKAVRIVTQPIF